LGSPADGSIGLTGIPPSWTTVAEEVISHFSMLVDGNAIALRPGTLNPAPLPCTTEQADRWVAETGRELHSKWMLVPTSVVSPHDTDKAPG
jgi:hypothetical protein